MVDHRVVDHRVVALQGVKPRPDLTMVAVTELWRPARPGKTARQRRSTRTNVTTMVPPPWFPDPPTMCTAGQLLSFNAAGGHRREGGQGGRAEQGAYSREPPTCPPSHCWPSTSGAPAAMAVPSVLRSLLCPPPPDFAIDFFGPPRLASRFSLPVHPARSVDRCCLAHTHTRTLAHTRTQHTHKEATAGHEVDPSQQITPMVVHIGHGSA